MRRRGSCSGSTAIQFSPPEPRLEWAQTPAVEARVVVGRVTDVETGEAIPGAYVMLGAPPNVVLSDDDGFFRLEPKTSPAAHVELYIVFIGYDAVRDTVPWSPTIGMAVEASLRKRASRGQCDIVCGEEKCAGGVRLLVRDLLTGAPPSGDITLIVKSGEVSDTTVSAREQGAPRLWMQAGDDLGIAGPFEVEVLSPAHEPWRVKDVWVEPRRCLPDGSRLIHAWLLPATDG